MPTRSEEIGSNIKKPSWLPTSWGIRFTIAVTGSLIAWWMEIWFNNGVSFAVPYFPGGRILSTTTLVLCAVMRIVFPVWAVLLAAEVLSKLGKRANMLSSVLLLSITIWIANALLKNWFSLNRDGSLRWLILSAAGAAILLYPLPIMRMKRKAVGLVALGDYDGALKISRIWLRSKVYGRPFQGWIMLQAGRFGEALELLRESAFDSKGRPLLKSQHLYFYAAALVSEEKYSEAQDLLEAAVLVPQKMQQYFRFTLADCLLSQKKEASRACELIEQVVTGLKRKTTSGLDRVFLHQCMAVHAWALASCGRRDAAEAKLEEAASESNSMAKEHLAALLHLKGMTRLALGDNELARVAFEQSLEIFPYGAIAAQARRQLGKVSGNTHE